MATLELRGIAKSFGDTTVLRALSLALNSGEMLVIVGASGCGKSTLLRLVAGLDTPTSGQILLDGVDITGRDPAKRDVAMVFQNYALYPHMSVAQNMGYALKLAGKAKAEIAAQVAQTAQLLGLETLLDRRPGALSGGQRQRVAMGRAIVRQPKLFLFDEPLSNLDAKLRVAMRADIRRLQKRLGVTSLYVTHDQTEAMTMADRLVVMQAGQAAQIGTPMEVFARPANIFVAQFMGQPAMNVFDPVPVGVHAPPGTLLGIRPENVVLGGDVTLTVELVEPLGSETLVHGMLPGGARLTVKRPGGPPGTESLQIGLPESARHYFDQATGQRL
jgi:sn-glycerol 3-phosphate transport system ATP-binding protein